MKIVISSGHGLKVRGASGLIDEVDEARRVVNRLKEILSDVVTVFHDDVSTSQNENLNRIVNFHNSQTRDLDVSVHFNAYTYTDGGRGTEVLYVSQPELADRVSLAISNAGGLINRGPQHRSDLFFLNKTEEPAILIEICFVDAKADVDAYEKNFEDICQAIAELVPKKSFDEAAGGIKTRGKVSWFGGPEDTGVSPSEGLAFIYDYEDAPELFLPKQPPGTTGLARRLNPQVNYIAMRWDYNVYPKEDLASGELLAAVYAPKTGRRYLARPADWGPNSATGRVADISKGLLDELGILTDDEVEVAFPVEGSV